MGLIDKIEKFNSKYILKSVFLYHLPKTHIKKIFRIKNFEESLNESFINFSFILENEYKKKK